MFIADLLMQNNVFINNKQIIEAIEGGNIDKILEIDNIKNKYRKLARKSINNFYNGVTLFTRIKMRYKSGFYSRNLNYALFYTLLSISISIFALSSFDAFKLYDQVDITFAISFTVVSIISIAYDFFTGADKEKTTLKNTYEYLLHLKNKSQEDSIV